MKTKVVGIRPRCSTGDGWLLTANPCLRRLPTCTRFTFGLAPGADAYVITLSSCYRLLTRKALRGRYSRASRRAATSNDARVVLSGVLGDHLLVECGDSGGDGLPAEVFPGVRCGLLAAAAPLACVGGGVGERCCERLLVVGWYEPAALTVADDLGRAVRVAGDHREAAGHRFDQREPERLRDRGQHEQVAGVERVGELVVGPPAGKEDVAGVEPADRLDRMLALPLARVAADQNERHVAPEPGLGVLVRLDQQGQPLDGCEAAQVEQHRLAGERRKVVVPVGDAAGRPLLIPALRVVDEPAPPERPPRLAA